MRSAIRKAKGTRTTQFFDIMASRGVYHDGWFASAPGPREPWVGGVPKGFKEWSPLTDKWELYNIDEDWSQANDLAAKNPQKLGADEGPLHRGIQEEQEPSDRRRFVVHRDCFIRRTPRHHRSPNGRSKRPSPACRSPLPQAGQGQQPCDHGRECAGKCQRRAVRACRFFRRHYVLREGRLPELRVQPVRGPAHEDPIQRQVAGG